MTNDLKIRNLYNEAEKYKNEARFSDNEFIARTQLGLFKLTMEKIAKLEATI